MRIYTVKENHIGSGDSKNLRRFRQSKTQTDTDPDTFLKRISKEIIFKILKKISYKKIKFT